MKLLENVNIPIGTTVFLGKPAVPMSQDKVDTIVKLIEEIKEVREAHLPQCFIPNVMKEPEQILILLLDKEKRIDPVVSRISKLLTNQSDISNISIYPMIKKNVLYQDVITAGMKIYSSEARNWFSKIISFFNKKAI